VRGKLLGLGIGRRSVQVGPLGTVQWIYVLLDRFLLMHYWYVIHWSHAWQGGDFLPAALDEGGKQGFTSTWSREMRGLCAEFFKASTAGDDSRVMAFEMDLRRLLEEELERMSRL
jgi:hypothetical protein